MDIFDIHFYKCRDTLFKKYFNKGNFLLKKTIYIYCFKGL